MRVSLVARYMAHPMIDFGTGRLTAHRLRLGLDRLQTVYHRSRSARWRQPTVGALRSRTSGFRFPSIGRAQRVPVRRAVSPFGLPRARRA